MGTKILKYLIVILCHMFMAMHGQIVNQTAPFRGSMILPGAGILLEDVQPVSTMYMGLPQYSNVLTFEVDRNVGNTVPYYQTTSWSATINVDIRYYTSATIFITRTKSYTLSFDATKPDATNLLKIAESLTHPVKSYQNRIGVVVNSFTVSPSSFTALKNAFSLELKYQRKGVLKPDFRTIFSASPATSINAGVLSFGNLPSLFPSADELDIEWTYIDEKSSFFAANSAVLVSNANSSGWNSKYLKFSRVTIPMNSPALKLPAIYNAGYIVYRVRQVYYDAQGNRLTGSWVESHNTILNKVATVNHSGNLNWTSSISFAEEGKHKDVVTYFDGSQRDRQSVTYDNSSSRPIIAETYYDKEGRKSAAILPAPHLTSSEIKYYPNFNLEAVTLQPYDADNFSYLPSCIVAPKKLSTTTGAAHYYSPSNIYKNGIPGTSPGSISHEFNQFIPDAEGYPLTISEYTNDNTGRIRRQTGVGAEFQFDKGRYTEYLYGKPSAKELDRLFGTDVGDASHYFKNTVIDPNGQQSITYTDLSGKTIATALEGSATNTTLVNASNNTGSTEQIDLGLIQSGDMRMNPQMAKSIGNATLTVPYDQVVTFTLDNAKSQFNNSNCKVSFCSDCYYDIDLTIKDNCGTNVNKFNYKNYDTTDVKNKNIDIDCNSFLNTIHKVESVSLNKGENYVSVDVKIPPKVIDFYEKRYLESDLCITTLDSLIKKHRLKISPANCIQTCQQCMDLYGDEEAYKNQLLAQIENSGTTIDDALRTMAAQAAKEAKLRCKLLCDGQNECEAKRDVLLADVSPGGQYCVKYYKDNEPPTFGISDNTHILHKLNTSNLKKPSGLRWNFPVPVPSVTSGYPKYANQVPDIDTLVENWTDEIAEYLVQFHPEYCYYEFCSANKDHTNFISDLDRVETWAEAISKGYIQAGMNPKDFATHIATNYDPYFKAPGSGASSLSDFNNKARNYNAGSGSTMLNIFELAVIMTSPELLNQNTKTVDLAIFQDVMNGNCSGQKNAAWLVFRNLYKQVVEEIYETNRENYVNANNSRCISVTDIGICSFNEPIKNLSWWMRWKLRRSPSNALQNRYCWKKARFENRTTLANAMRASMAVGTDINAEKAKSKDSLRLFCDTNCINMAEGWINSLSYCPELQDKNSLLAGKIKAGLIAVCRSSCGETDYPSGASSVSHIDPNAKKIGPDVYKILLPGPDGGWVGSFQDVIELYLPSSRLSATNSTAGSCNSDLIDYPEAYKVKPHFEPTKLLTKVDSCSCERLTVERTLFTLNPQGTTTLYQFLLNKYKNPFNPKLPSEDFHMSEKHFNILVESCRDRTCQYLPEEIELPYIFECYEKVDCDKFNYAKNQFIAEFKVLNPDPAKRLISPSDPQFNKLYAGYLNRKLGINASYIDYRKFEGKCDSCKNNCYLTDYIRNYVETHGWSSRYLSMSDFTTLAIDYNTQNNTFFTGENILMMFLTFRRIDCYELNKFYTTTAIPAGGIFNTTTKTINARLKTEFDNYYKTKLATDVVEYMFTKCMVENKPITDYKCDIAMFSKPHSPDTDPDPDDSACARRMDSAAVTSAMYEYQIIRQESLNDFKNKYIAHCLTAANTTLSALMRRNEFHYTLYYYGQDGNLLATVPPAGVRPLDASQVATVEVNRAAGVPQPAEHIMKTTYEYNSLNQVIAQNTPDGGSSRFIYDQLGRLILSQNAKQEAAGKASYTIYDKLGRISESGEWEISTGHGLYSQFINFFTMSYLPYADYHTWIQDMKAAATLHYVTRTYYDVLAPVSTASLQSQFGGVQQNLRHRIATITLDEKDIDKNASSYHTALHYSYDVLGNVKTLVSENNYASQSYASQKYKTVQYDYDLVSGKVNKVAYQKGKPDQFIYKYTYDAENRIQNLFSSKDDIVYTQEVQYEYYLHGPLARTIYGEDQVQGIDYAYTLQGWLKGINASTLNAKYDMGRDGDPSLVGNVNAKTATDAIALTLRYYQNDYKQIARTTSPVEATLPAVGLGNNPLYNGNIGSSIVSLKNMDPQGYQYTYDQLNRIIAMDVHKQPAVSANNMSSASPSPDYRERISYDPNGNILTYNRNMDNAANMDDLKYNYYYYPSGGGAPVEYDPLASPPTYSPGDRVTNQLASVNDALGAPVLTGKDIGTQTPNNYQYDEIGNLIRDDQENMDIEWTPTGKIAKITNINKNLVITFAYDPMGNRVMKKVDDGGQIKLTYYTRDAQGNPLATYANNYTDVNTTQTPSASSLWWIETPLYGSSRIGMVQPNLEVANATSPYPDWIRNYFKGKRQYELTNHLGNVLATIKDEKKQMQFGTGTTIDFYDPIVYTATDYYPFGMPMPNRTYSLSSGSKYRFGYSGKEKDNEIAGEGNHIDFGDRGYDTRRGQWWSVDAKTGKYPSISPYAFCLNNPIAFIDPDGNDVILFDQKGNTVATITKAGTVIEKGMENSAILKSYVATKEYFKGTSGEADFTDFENASKILNIKATAKPEGAANFQNSGFENVSGIDANGNKKLEVEEITSADYKSATEFGTIEWNPLTGGIDAEGNRHSPAMIFAHELKHAKHFKDNLAKYVKDLLTKKKGVDNVEEENAINETNTISGEKKNGDGGNGADKKRTTHGAKGLFKAKSTTSNQAAPAPVKKKK